MGSSGIMPSRTQSLEPRNIPTIDPSASPSDSPHFSPSAVPTTIPSPLPTLKPSTLPSIMASSYPSITPTMVSSSAPSVDSSHMPTTNPSASPSDGPSSIPSAVPTSLPSSLPSLRPSTLPSIMPSRTQSLEPSNIPTIDPSASPSDGPSSNPSAVPTTSQSTTPTLKPNTWASSTPSVDPSHMPTTNPIASPSDGPNSLPPNCVDQDVKIGFALPDGRYTNCDKVSLSLNSSCNIKVVEENCPRLCKTCPLCTDSKEYVFMGIHGKKLCSYAQMDLNLCNTYLWLKDLCPSTCESCCRDQTGSIPFNRMIGSPTTCESFKLAKNQKYCTWQRIQKSCPKSCNACDKSPRPCSDVTYPIWVDGGLKSCKMISKIGSQKNFCMDWDNIKSLCPVSCGTCSRQPTHLPSRYWDKGKGKGGRKLK